MTRERLQVPFRRLPLQGLFIRRLELALDGQGGPCDQFAGTNTGYQLINASNENALFKPRLSGSYRGTLRVQTPDGEFVCSG